MNMSWIDVVGIKRVAWVDRYVDDELVVWIPRPRSTRRDSSGRLLELGVGSKIQKYEITRRLQFCSYCQIRYTCGRPELEIERKVVHADFGEWELRKSQNVTTKIDVKLELLTRVSPSSTSPESKSGKRNKISRRNPFSNQASNMTGK
jgi:hypothetical protein